MGTGIHGGFGGTSGSRDDERQKKESACADNEQLKVAFYQSTLKLRQHIEFAEETSSNSDGIKGAHNRENFLNEIARVGAKIIDTIQNSKMIGIEKIFYQMPMKDGKGNLTGGYKTKIFCKTIYDPKIISTDQYIDRGLQAANHAAETSNGKLGREWTGTDTQGIEWHGYCDKSGNITSFYPED